MKFITKKYNWKYIPKVNEEYKLLSKAVMETYKKIIFSLKEELKYQ